MGTVKSKSYETFTCHVDQHIGMFIGRESLRGGCAGGVSTLLLLLFFFFKSDQRENMKTQNIKENEKTKKIIYNIYIKKKTCQNF